MSKPRKFSKKNCVDNDSRFYKSEFDHLFKRELINKRAYMYFQIIENARNSGAFPFNGKGITRADLCMALYQNIKIIDFFASHVALMREISHPEIDNLVAKWLEEKYTIWWLLTCEAVDDLIADDLLEEVDDEITPKKYLIIKSKNGKI